MKLSLFFLLAVIAGCSSARKNSAPADSKSQAQRAQAPAAAQQKPASEASSDSSTVTCKHGQDSRQLAVEKKDAGCVLNYTKAEGTTAVANAMHGSKYCSEKLDKIRGNLEKSGFECK